MSKFVKVQTELRDLPLIKRALDDLNMPYEENSTFVHRWSGFQGKVPLVVRHGSATFGLRRTAEQGYEVIGDDMQFRQIRSSLDLIQQRYAYHKVLAETERAGFSLVEEQTDKGNVIRLSLLDTAIPLPHTNALSCRYPLAYPSSGFLSTFILRNTFSPCAM